MAKPDVIDLTSVLKRHQNTWVALTSRYDKVVASAATPKKVLERAKKKGYDNPLILWAAADYGAVVPAVL